MEPLLSYMPLKSVETIPKKSDDDDKKKTKVAEHLLHRETVTYFLLSYLYEGVRCRVSPGDISPGTNRPDYSTAVLFTGSNFIGL